MSALLRVFLSCHGICVSVFLYVTFCNIQCAMSIPPVEHKKMYLGFDTILSIIQTKDEKQIMKLEILRDDEVYLGKKHELYGAYINEIEAARKEVGDSKEASKEKQKSIEQKYNIWKNHIGYSVARLIELDERFKYKLKVKGNGKDYEEDYEKGDTIVVKDLQTMSNSLTELLKRYKEENEITFDDVSDEEVNLVFEYVNDKMHEAAKSVLNGYGSDVELENIDGTVIKRRDFNGCGLVADECMCTIVDI